MLQIKRKKLNLNYISFGFSVLTSFVGSALLYLFFPNLKETLGSFTGYLGLLIVCVIIFAFLVSSYFIGQIGIFFYLSDRNLGLTWRHYRRLAKASNPLYRVNVIALIILIVSLVSLCFQITTKAEVALETKELTLPITAVFCVFGPILIVMIYSLVEFKYKKWAIKKYETLSIALANTSGLMNWDKKENKDKLVYDNLYSLRDFDFIFIWAIHFSTIIGKENDNSLWDLDNLLSANPNGVIYVLLQCPFCESVIERSIELDHPYNENYVDSPIESISNCLAQQSERVKVVLRHGTPYFRTVLWGKKKCAEDNNYNPLSSVNDVPSPSTLDTPEERFLSQTGQGGFIAQEYPRGVHGSQAPLIKGSVSVHGGMWNSIRLKFAEEFLKGIRLQEPYGQDNEEALRCLAFDLGIDKKKVSISSREQLEELIKKKEKWDKFLRRIIDTAKTKAGLLAKSTS